MNFFEQDQQQEKDYWFNQIPKHGEDVFNYGPNYYINIILNKIMSKFQLPSHGKICMLGTHNCYSFSLLEEFYGKERCIGYDLYNPTKRINIVEGSITNLNPSDVPQLAFCWNDLGNYSRNPYQKMYAQILFANKIINNGIFIGRDHSNRARFPVNALMKEYGFSNYTLHEYFKNNNINSAGIDSNILKSHLVSIREKY